MTFKKLQFEHHKLSIKIIAEVGIVLVGVEIVVVVVIV